MAGNVSPSVLFFKIVLVFLTLSLPIGILEIACHFLQKQHKTLISIASAIASSSVFSGSLHVFVLFQDSDLKQYWMPDSQCKECYDCSEKFTTFRRRHHCRLCGQIFCSRCCNQEIPGKFMGYTGKGILLTVL